MHVKDGQIGPWDAIYHSIKPGFEGQVAKKFLNGI